MRKRRHRGWRMTWHRSGEWCEGWGRSRSGCRDIDMPASHTHLHVTSWGAVLPDPHPSLAASNTHFSMSSLVGRRCHRTTLRFRRTLTPATCLPSILQLKRRQTHLTKIKWWEKYSHLFVWCVFYVQREARLFSLAAVEGGRRGRKGGGEREENPKCREICFPFPPWLLWDITQQKKDASEKKRVRYTDCHTKHPSSVPQGTPRHPHPVIHPPMVVMRRRLQCCCCSC